MKYYSEVTKQYYDTAKVCQEAEDKVIKQKKAEELSENDKKLMLSKKKKELSDSIELADKAVSDAYTQYNATKDKVTAILRDANLKAEEMLKESHSNIEKATESRMKAILAFNREFGPYKKLYTGDDALKQFSRMTDVSSWFDSFFRFLI